MGEIIVGGLLVGSNDSAVDMDVSYQDLVLASF
jgi:hypothetical protein